MDIRSKKTDLVAQSEDQDDELLSIVAIKGFVKFPLKRQLFGRVPRKGVILIGAAKTLCSAIVTILVDFCRNFPFSLFP